MQNYHVKKQCKELSAAVRAVAKARLGNVHTVDEAVATAASKKRPPALGRLRFERRAEGRSVQILHVGSSLSDARKTEPARLGTILRQPVRALDDRAWP